MAKRELTVEQLENMIADIRSEMEIGAKTAAYGIEATMPKGKGGTSDPVAFEVERRAKKNKKLQEYEFQLIQIQERIDKVKGMREKQILDYMLDGKSKRYIGDKMGLSHTHISNIKKKIAEQMME